MMDILILVAAATLLAGLLFFEKRDSTRGLLLTKPLLYDPKFLQPRHRTAALFCGSAHDCIFNPFRLTAGKSRMPDGIGRRRP